MHAGERVVVIGVLYLDEALGFRIFQATGEGYDEHIVLDIDDPIAAAALRDALVCAEGQTAVYLGPGVVDAEARAEGGTLVVAHVLTVYLGDALEHPRDLRVVAIRPNPWAR